MIYVKLSKGKWSNPKKIIAFCVTIIFTGLGLTATVISLLNLIGVIKTD